MLGDWLRTLGFAALGAAVTTASVLAYGSFLPTGRALPGLWVGGQIQPRELALGDWLEQRRLRLLGREAHLRLPGAMHSLRFGDLGVELDVSGTMNDIARDAEAGSPFARMYRALEARRYERSLPLRWRFDPRRARAVLEKLAPQLARAPHDARLDLDAHSRLDEIPGRELDVEKTLRSIAAGERQDDAVFEVVTRAVPAQVTASMLSVIDVSRVLSAFESKFGGTGAGRAQNIASAARYLDGTVLAPGQTLSFNEVVGPRQLERGFAWAPVIVDDELEPGVGGGVCQVASTLHAAAVYGALDVLERRSHSRPSGYVPLGLDATVVYGEVDLKLRNPYREAIIIHAFVPAPNQLRVELLGMSSPGKIEHTYAVLKTHDFYRRVTTKPWFASDRQIRRQKGKKGYDILSLVSVARADGSKQERRYSSHYQPVPEVFWVGPGAALGDLPELPEGAEHVEIDGVREGADVAALPFADPGG